MSDAIDRAAEVIADFNACGHCEGTCGTCRGEAEALDAAGLLRGLPRPEGGCTCIPFSQDAGGGHFEHLLEYEPACPEHSEHLWDPRQGMWVDRAAYDAEVIEKFLREHHSPVFRIENPEFIAPFLAKAWDEGFKQGGPMHDENLDDPDAHTRNPYREGGTNAQR